MKILLYIIIVALNMSIISPYPPTTTKVETMTFITTEDSVIVKLNSDE
ncbi:hypothetical protein KAR91_53300 [Candidatus Pacearchaeota archaeon]|nr:hypothetical protein [Candidatus Pacearchaeota archaeon]